MIIRKAGMSDIEEILNLAYQLRKTEAKFDKNNNIKEDACQSDFYRKKTIKYISSRKKIFLVAENNNKVVGYINGFIEENAEIFHKKPIAYLDNLCVAKEARRQGIGKNLIDEFNKIVKEKGAGFVKLNAFKNNIPAVKLYEQEGFEEYSVYYIKKI